MQDVVIAKPYQFVPPDRGRFWPAVFRPLLRPLLAKVWGVTTVEIVGIESLRSALREPPACYSARITAGRATRRWSRCSGPRRALRSILWRAGTSSWAGASKAWLLRRLGAFSVYREGLDRTAVRTAVELLVEVRRPLAIFPEGIITRSNDRLGALDEGPAFIAHSAAKQRARNEPGARTLLIPVALRYRFLGRLEESAGPVLDRIETRLTWAPRPDLPLIERLRRAGDAILGLKELELVGEFRHATIAGRLARLVTISSGRSRRNGRSRRGKETSRRGCARFARRSCRISWKGGSPTPSATGAGTSSPGFSWRSGSRSIRPAISRGTRAQNACSRQSNDSKKT